MELDKGDSVGGRYEVLDTLGFGGAGDVYRVTDHVTDAERALKLLYDDQLGTESLRQRFLTEARIMAELQHPNVLPVFDLGEHGDRVYFVMEYAPLGNAREQFDRGEVDLRLAAEVILQVLDALEYAHQHNCIHRDVKPANILITQPGRYKLADFGVARYDALGVARVTTTGDYLGTLGYMAPEQRVDPRRVVPQSDLYAVGAALYNLLSGHPRPPPDLYALAVDELTFPDIPHRLLPIIRRATRAAVGDRYASASEMRDALAQAVELTWDS
ncbi:MAG: serine/threonine protein kinase [Alphaproteobacteria bacterium]|nr:serine/threonine protein kinase [Alphaproteobacteria bacterium]